MDKNKEWIKDIENNELKNLPKKDILLYKTPQRTNERILNIIKKSKSIDKKEKIKKRKIFDFIPFNKTLKLSFAAISLFIIFLSIYFIFYQKSIPLIFRKNKLITRVIYTTGNTNLIKDSIIKKLIAGDLIENQESIKTDEDTKSIIQLGDRALVLLRENSEIQFLKMIEKKNTNINISLKKGTAIFKVNKLVKNSKFKVTVNDININVIGTQFLVQNISEKSTLIAALSGKIEINSKSNNQLNKIILYENKLLIIEDDKITEKILSDDISKYFKDIQNINNVNLNDYSSLKIINNENNIALYLNKKIIFEFNKNLEFILSTGKYLLELKKDDVLIYQEEFNITSEEKITKEIIINKNDLAIKKENEKNNLFLQWKSKIIYQLINNNDSSKNKILGFTHSKKRIVALSQSALLCFDTNGKLIWEKIYGKKRSIYFMSTPIIYQGKVFASSLNKKLVILDLISGKELKVLDTPGNITFGYTILPYKNKLFLPYTNGIYILNTNNHVIDEKVFIPFNSPTKPLIYNNKIYLSSFIYKKISCYDLNGNELWNFYFNDISFNSPVIFKNALFISDKKGIIYKISLSGKLITKVILPSGVISNITSGTEFLYILANNGKIYKIDYKTLNIKELFKSDDKFDDYIYLFKKPVEYNNKLLIGTDKGDLVIFDLMKNTILNKIRTSDKPISTPIYQISSDTSFVGTEDGKVFIIK